MNHELAGVHGAATVWLQLALSGCNCLVATVWLQLSGCNCVELPEGVVSGATRCRGAVLGGAAMLPAVMWANSAAAALWTVLLTEDSSAVTKGAGAVRECPRVGNAHKHKSVNRTSNTQNKFLG